MCDYLRKEGRRGNLDVTHQATVVLPEVPAVLPLSACWCRHSSCNTHAIVLLGPFSNVVPALAWAYQTLMDSSMALRMNSVPGVWGPGHSMWARCMEGVRKAAATPVQPAPTAGGAPMRPDSPPFDPATLRAAGEPAPTHGTGTSKPKGGAPFRAALHRGGTWCLAPYSVGGPVHRNSHCGDVVHAVRCNVALLVTIEPIEGEATTQRVVCCPSGLIAGPRRYGGPILQPVAQRCRGELALIPPGHRGEKGERAAEEPC